VVFGNPQAVHPDIFGHSGHLGRLSKSLAGSATLDHGGEVEE
jgi:hypothetical protein